MKSLDGINKTPTVTSSTKSRLETFKTVLIAVMITAVVFFLFGMHVANANNASKMQAVKAATTQLK